MKRIRSHSLDTTAANEGNMNEQCGEIRRESGWNRQWFRRILIFASSLVALVLLVLVSKQATYSTPFAAPTNSIRITSSNARFRIRRIRRRRLEDAAWNDYDDDQEQGNDGSSQRKDNTFVDMFVNSPKEWTALEWGIFAGLLTLFGILFCCWCLVCVIPQCFGHRAALAYAAMAPTS